jgi:hypothetical protein
MQQTVSEITSVENQINLFFHNHSLGKLLRQCGIRKEKGISLEVLFQFLLALAFTGKNLFRNMEPSGSFDGIFKDAVYRFQNSAKANWRRFLLLLSTRIIVSRLEPLTDASNLKVLIVDDTLFLRDRSMPKITYTFGECAGEKQVTLKALFKLVHKRPGRANVLATCLVSIGNDDKGKPVPAKIVFVRDRNSRSWLALLATDMTLTDEEIITLYKRRWDIETFFKIAKSFLKFAKESQSRSYDAMVAHATLVCCRYLLLEIGKRTTADPRTLGTLFYATCEEIQQTSFTEALAILLKMLERVLRDIVGFSKEQVEHLVQQLIEQLPPVFRGRLLLLVTAADKNY